MLRLADCNEEIIYTYTHCMIVNCRTVGDSERVHLLGIRPSMQRHVLAMHVHVHDMRLWSVDLHCSVIICNLLC